jgi:glutaredoxin-related protein
MAETCNTVPRKIIYLCAECMRFVCGLYIHINVAQRNVSIKNIVANHKEFCTLFSMIFFTDLESNSNFNIFCIYSFG